MNASIGGGLMMPHPNGIVIHPDAEIGINCLLMTQVVIGVTNASRPPIIGNGVDIGAGAKVLGPVIVGNNAKIGANAVVIDDVPNNATAVGVPAKIIAANLVPKTK